MLADFSPVLAQPHRQCRKARAAPLRASYLKQTHVLAERIMRKKLQHNFRYYGLYDVARGRF